MHRPSTLLITPLPCQCCWQSPVPWPRCTTLHPAVSSFALQPHIPRWCQHPPHTTTLEVLLAEPRGPLPQRNVHTPCDHSLHRHPVVLGPLAHGLDDHLDLRVARVGAQHGHHVAQAVARLAARDHGLEGADARALLALQVLGCRVQPLQHVKRLGRVEERAHLVRVVGDELQQLVALLARLHLEVQLPSQPRAPVHDVAARQVRKIAVLGAVLFVLDERQRLLRLPVLAARGLGDAVVPVEVVVVGEVGLDGLQEHQHVLELLEQEEARRHALAAGDGVALALARAHQLEVLLRRLEVVGGALGLADARVHHALQDVLLRRGGLQVLDQVERLPHLVVAQVVDDQVQARLRRHVTQRRQVLQRVLTPPEHHQVVADEVVLQVAAARGLGQRLDLGFRRLAVVHAERVARLEVDRHRTVAELVQVHLQDLERHVVVVQLAVAQRHVHVERQELAVLQQQPLVDVGGLLEVRALVVDGRQRQLVLDRLGQLLVVVHELGLVAALVRAVEQHARLQRAARALRRGRLRLLVHAHEVVAGRRVHVVQRVGVLKRQQLLVDVERLVMFPVMEMAVC
mmetsp:Transcript_34611/g.87565  ORF Transcript_34611/g.87565 Transcript_34611/m.87565 type:complete len:572 (-) Transcript_34611:381-2096(-)